MKTLLFLFFVVGSFTSYGQTAPTESQENFQKVQLFPNPTSEIIFIRHGELIDSYRIIDLQGRTLQEGIKNAQVISLIDLPVGYYIFEMKIGNDVERVRIQKN
jgi:hypothetical protein